MEMYNRWFEKNIEWRLNEMKDPIKRIKFLYHEKDIFISLNRSLEATQIEKRFDTLIDREKTLMEISRIEMVILKLRLILLLNQKKQTI